MSVIKTNTIYKKMYMLKQTIFKLKLLYWVSIYYRIIGFQKKVLLAHPYIKVNNYHNYLVWGVFIYL